MKRLLTSVSTSCALAVILAGPVHAAKESKQNVPDLRSTFLAEDIVKKDVVTSRGENVGEVKKLLINDKGQVTHAVIDVGGILGVGEKSFVVPWDNLKVTKGAENIVLDMPKSQIKEEFAAWEVLLQEQGPTTKQRPQEEEPEE